MNRLRSTLSAIVAKGRTAVRADLRERIAQNTATVLVGHIARLGLGLISSALLARGLGAEGLSLLAIVGATMSIGGTVADFGLRMSAIRQIAAEVDAAPSAAQQTATTYAWLKTGGTLVLALLLAWAPPALVRLLRLPPDAGAIYLRLGAVGVIATASSGIVGTVLQALQRFRPLTVMQTGNVALTVVLTALLFWSDRLTVGAALLVGAVAAVAAAGLGYVALPSPWRAALWRPARLCARQTRELLSFSRWLWLSNILSIVSVQLDVLLLGYWLPLAQVGYYALARNLAFKADVLNQTLHAVLLPNVSARRGALSLKSYIRRSLARSGLLLALVLLSLPLARPFIVLVYGEPFAPAVGIFIALMLVVGLDLVTSPLILVALPMQRPRLLAVADAIQVALLVLLSIAAIPSLGVYGVILARFVAKLVGAAAVLVPLMVRLRSEEPLALPPDLRPIEGTSPTPPSGDPM